MRIGKGSGLILLGSVLIFAAFGLMCRNMYDANRAQASAESVMEQLQEQMPDYHRAEQPVPEETEIPADRPDSQREMTVQTVDGRPYIGVLSIPVLELELPVIQQWNYPDLRVAPCRYEGSAYSGNLVIAAHNYESHFGNLKRLQPGDQISFTDMDGTVFRYEVSVLETLEPTAVEEMTAGDWALSLFTCTVGGKLRLTVRCRLLPADEPSSRDNDENGLLLTV